MKPWWMLVILAWTGAQAAEQVEYPTRPVRVILPQGPGSTTDLLGRIVFTHTSERLGKQLVVDNHVPYKGGASMMARVPGRGAPWRR